MTQDSRLRYYACEALYNIVKVASGAVLPHFNVLFDGLSKVTRVLILRRHVFRLPLMLCALYSSLLQILTPM